MRTIRLAAGLAGLAFMAQSCSQPYEAPFRNVADMREVMEGMTGPLAQVVFDSVMTIVDESGTTEVQPSTPEEWQTVADSAMALAESANILLMEAHTVDEQWNTMALAMSDAALVAADAARAQDPQGLFDAGGEIFVACDGCHSAYNVTVE